MRPGVALAVGFVAVLTTSACSAPHESPAVSAPSAAALPTHRDLGGGPTALFRGTLAHEGACLFAEGGSGTGRELLIWPAGFTLRAGSPDAVLDSAGSPVASVGAQISVGGGEYHQTDYAFLRTLMTSDVPAECQGGNYWLVTQVVAGS